MSEPKLGPLTAAEVMEHAAKLRAVGQDRHALVLLLEEIETLRAGSMPIVLDSSVADDVADFIGFLAFAGGELPSSERFKRWQAAVMQTLRQFEEDADESDKLRRDMADLLTRTADALKGPPQPLCSHSWHDLPELAAAAMQCVEPIDDDHAEYTFDQALNLGRLWAAGKVIAGDPYAAAATMAKVFDHDANVLEQARATLRSIETPPDPDTVDRALPETLEILSARFAAYQKQERGANLFEVNYWRMQYKQLAGDCIAALKAVMP